MPLSEDAVREELKKVIDPELFVNIVDLGLIYVVDINEKKSASDETPEAENAVGENIDENSDAEKKYDVNIEMTLTSPMCPAGPQLVGQSKQVVSAIEGVDEVDVKVVMDPPWTPDCMTEEARDKLNMF